MTNGQGTNPRSMSMADLAIALHRADPGTPGFDRLFHEVQRRWTAAGDQHARLFQRFGDVERVRQVPHRDELAAIEEARQYLGIQTLIHELWILQEAHVEPAELFRNPGTVRRVRAVLRREQDRGEPAHGSEPDPDARTLRHLSYWAELALFGRGDQLVWDQRRLAGTMMAEITEGSYRLCRQRLAELKGPWSLELFLTNPVGKAYHQPLDPDDLEMTLGLDVALGRPGTTFTPEEILAAHSRTGRSLAAEMTRVAREDPPDMTGAMPPHYRTIQQRQSLLQTMREEADSLTTAIGVASLAADGIMRVDGRPVPARNVPWVLGAHQDSVNYLLGYFGTISVAGLRVTFEADPGAGAVAVVDAAGVTKRMHPGSLAPVLAIVTSPNPVTYLAKMRVGIDDLGRQLATEEATTTAQAPMSTGLRPGSPVSRQPTTHLGIDRHPRAR